MAASDDFKQLLKAGKIVEALALALGEAVELKITTWVSTESTADAQASTFGQDSATSGNRMETRINLVDGEIDNEIGNQFIANGPYTELRNFHQQQIAQSYKFIQNNLHSLQQLLEVWASMQQLGLSDAESQLLPTAKETAPSLPVDSRQEPAESSEVEESDIATQVEPTEMPSTPQSASTPLPPTDLPTLDQLDLGTHESWKSSVGAEIPQPDTSHLGTDGLQENLLQKPELPEPESSNNLVLSHLMPTNAQLMPTLEQLHLGTDRGWEKLIAQQLHPQQATPALTQEQLLLGTALKNSVEQNINPNPATPTPDNTELNSQQEEEWDNWVIDNPENVAILSAPEQAVLEPEEEDEWDNWVLSNPENVATAPAPRNTSLGEQEEDWEDWIVEQPGQVPVAVPPSVSIDNDWQQFVNEPLDFHPLATDPFNNLDESAWTGNLEAELIAERHRLEQLELEPHQPEVIASSTSVSIPDATTTETHIQQSGSVSENHPVPPRPPTPPPPPPPHGVNNRNNQQQ